MRWFGHVDDAGGRWKIDVENVVRQVGLGILRQCKVGFRFYFIFSASSHSPIPRLILTTFLTGPLPAE